jgi:hypothetical protein
MKHILNKWQFQLSLNKNYIRGYGYVLMVGILKITSLPDEGFMLSKKNYKGFLITKYL